MFTFTISVFLAITNEDKICKIDVSKLELTYSSVLKLTYFYTDIVISCM